MPQTSHSNRQVKRKSVPHWNEIEANSDEKHKPVSSSGWRLHGSERVPQAVVSNGVPQDQHVDGEEPADIPRSRH